MQQARWLHKEGEKKTQTAEGLDRLEYRRRKARGLGGCLEDDL
jgi:hypothetical protein